MTLFERDSKYPLTLKLEHKKMYLNVPKISFRAGVLNWWDVACFQGGAEDFENYKKIFSSHSFRNRIFVACSRFIHSRQWQMRASKHRLKITIIEADFLITEK